MIEGRFLSVSSVLQCPVEFCVKSEVQNGARIYVIS